MWPHNSTHNDDDQHQKNIVVLLLFCRCVTTIAQNCWFNCRHTHQTLPECKNCIQCLSQSWSIWLFWSRKVRSLWLQSSCCCKVCQASIVRHADEGIQELLLRGCLPSQPVRIILLLPLRIQLRTLQNIHPKINQVWQIWEQPCAQQHINNYCHEHRGQSYCVQKKWSIGME